MANIYLSLGSNIGNTRQNLEEAINRLKDHIEIIKLSSYYETEPVDYKEQDWFLNIVIQGKTNLSPIELLNICQEIEKEMKRIKTIRFGPRIIDVDILLYEDYKSNNENLTIPHPRMTDRAFVMFPLYEIAPQLIIDGKTIKDIINNLKEDQIKKLEDK